MVVVDLYVGKIGDAVFPLCKNSVAVGAVNTVQYFAFFRPLNQGSACLLTHMIGDIIFHRLLRCTVTKGEGGEQE